MSDTPEIHHARSLIVLATMARSLTQTTDLRSVFSVTHDTIERLIRFDGLSIGVLTGQGRIAVSVALDRDTNHVAIVDQSLSDWVRTVEDRVEDSSTSVDMLGHLRGLFSSADVQRAIYVPLVSNRETIGFLAAMRRDNRGFGPGTEAIFDIAGHLVAQAAFDTALREQADQAATANATDILATIRTLARLVDQRESAGLPHSDRVAALSEAIAAELQLPSHEIELVRVAAILHDAGKIGIPADTLTKTGVLNDEDRALLMTHPALGASMAEAHGVHPDIVPLIRHHHEWFDGRGYPDGLAGDEIPLGAAIIGSAEAFDRMTSGMPYRSARSMSTVRQHLVAGSGKQFHPAIVEATLRVVEGFERRPIPFLHRVPDQDVDGEPVAPSLVEQQQRDMRPAGTFKILYEIAHEIGAIPELGRFLRQIAQIIGAEISVGNCTIFLLERESGNLVATGRYPESDKPIDTRPSDEALIAAILDGAPTMLDSEASGGGHYVVPLVGHGQPIGAIVVAAAANRRLRQSERRVLSAIAGQVAAAIAVAQQHADARRGAITDGLTGAFNYRYLMERLEAALERDENVSLMLIDMDSLKRVNDDAGHLAGDALLTAAAASLASGVRRSDVVSRYGGDEFVILMPGTPHDEAVAIAARLATDLDALPEARIGSQPRGRAVSYGVSTAPTDGRSATALLEAADARMYIMKRAGGGSQDD